MKPAIRKFFMEFKVRKVIDGKEQIVIETLPVKVNAACPDHHKMLR